MRYLTLQLDAPPGMPFVVAAGTIDVQPDRGGA